MAYYGGVQGVGDGTVLGWVWDPEQPDLRLSVAVEVDGRVVGEGSAAEERDDLVAAKVDGAGHGFKIKLPDSLREPGSRTLRVVAGPERALVKPAPSFWVNGRNGWDGVDFEIEAPTEEESKPARDRRPLILLGAGMFLCALVLLLIAQHFSFFADEWTFALDRRGWNADALLGAHNGHLVLVPAFVYKILFELVGLAHSWPYRLALIAFHLCCVGLIYALASKRFGPWLALVPAGLILFPGSSHDDLLWPFQIAFVGSMAFGLGALLCLDREERRFDIAAAVLVALSIASSTVGLAFAIGILAELALTRGERPRMYVALAPIGLYLLWFVGFHTSDDALQASNIFDVPHYDARTAAQGFAGFANLPIALGTILLLGTAGWLGIKALNERGLPARAFVGIVGGLAFWTLAALARAQIGDAIATRYVYPSMVFILIAVIASLPPVRRVSWQVWAVLAAFLCFAFVNNYGPLKSYADFRTKEDALGVADVSAEALAARDGDPWVAAIRALDYPALSATELMALPLDQQLRADENLIAVDQVEYGTPTPEEERKAFPAPVQDVHSVAKKVVTVGGLTCRRLTGTASDALAALRVPAGRDLLLLRTGRRDPEVNVRMRRLSTEFQRTPVPFPSDPLPERGSAGVIRIIDDSSDLPWYARVEFAGPVALCLVPPLA